MITHVRFQNYKALKNAELKLGAFNVIIGPNGSGKSSVLQGLEAMGNPDSLNWKQTVTAGNSVNTASIVLNFHNSTKMVRLGVVGAGVAGVYAVNEGGQASVVSDPESKAVLSELSGIKIFSFQAALMPNAADPRGYGPLNRDGSNLAQAITFLRDKDEDAYNALRSEMQKWIPEYESIGFDLDQNNYRKLTLRQKISRQQIPASQLSEGTLLALALLTIVHQSSGPTLIGLEEPDRGLHPRLLRELRDALYRLSFPSDFGINRPPIQVVITTHSPLFLDLFKDHPEQVIIAEKSVDGSATFKNLSDDAQLREIIGDAPLGEVWYSGILGGVPVAA